MAGITTAAITAGAGLVGSGIQMFGAARDRKRAQRELDNYERVELTNPYRDMQISTMGSDLMREESQRNSATAYDVLGTAGDRAILGGMGKVVASGNQANRQAALDLDRQFQQRQQAIAGGEMNLLQMKEARDNQNITALSSQINDAQQRFDSGMMGIASSLGAGARAYQGAQTNQELAKIASNGAQVPSVVGTVNEESAGTMQGTYNPFIFYDSIAPDDPLMGDWYNRLRKINNRSL